MDIGGLKFFQAMKGKMHWLGQNQQVLSQNVANAETPDYVANELRPLSFGKVLRTHERGKAVNGLRPVEGSIDSRAEKRRHPYEIAPTGNAVILEEEMLKMSQAADQHRMTNQLYKKYSNMFRMVIKGGG